MIKIEQINDWHEAINQVVVGDCLDLMRKMEDKCVDLVLTDPPYGINADKNAYKNGQNCKANGFREYEQTEWDNESIDKKMLDEIFRISKNQIIWGANHFISKMPKDSSCWIVWNKKQRNFSFADGELAWASFDKAVRMFDFSRGELLSENGLHPTQKPKELMKWCLEKYSKQSDLIFDPFMGSFTTARACKDLGRNFIGAEISESYCTIGEDRLRQQNLI